MLLRRVLLDAAPIDSLDLGKDDSGVVTSSCDDPRGDDEAVDPTSTASICAVQPLDKESSEFIDSRVLRRVRYLFTSIRLLK